MRRLLRILSLVLVAAGVLMLADAALTLTWKEPVSAVYAEIEQGKLDDRLEALERESLTPVDREEITRLPRGGPRLAYAARRLERRVAAGEPLGRLALPSIGVSEIVVAGTSTSALRKGPGHYPDTVLPGRRGTVAIAGHRTTYGAPFRKLDDLRDGDAIELRMPYGTFRYRVQRTRIVQPTATWVTDDVGHDRLVLSACHPLYSAEQRIIVFARLVESEPRGSAAVA